MKKILSISLIALIVLSTFSMFAPQVGTTDLGDWITNLTPLPNPTALHSSIVHNGKICVIGGVTTDGVTLANVYYADVDPEGAVGSWHETTPLPEWRECAGAVVWNNFVYVMGGAGPVWGGRSEQNTVYYAAINPDGTVGEWNTDPHQLPERISGFGAVVWNGKIYVAGGWNGYSRQDEVYFADINEVDGSLDGWTENPTPLPLPLNSMCALTYESTMFIIGGIYANEAQSAVYYAHFSEIDGTLGGWSPTSPLPEGRAKGGCALIGDEIYVIGGHGGHEEVDVTPKETVYETEAHADGVGSWVETESLPEGRREHSVVTLNGRIYVMGGRDLELNPIDTIYYSSFSRAPYRRMITIDNTGNPNTLTDYQVFINVTYDPNMQTHFDDLRFTWYDEASGEEVDIDYWLDKYVDSEYALVWVEVPEIRGSGEEVLYMYYGDPDAVSESNGEETFVFFDGFSTDTTADYDIFRNANAEMSWNPNGWLIVDASERESSGRNSNVRIYHKTAQIDATEEKYWLETRCEAVGTGLLDYLGPEQPYKYDSDPKYYYALDAWVRPESCYLSSIWGYEAWEFREGGLVPNRKDEWYRIGLGTSPNGTVFGRFCDDDYSEIETVVNQTVHQNNEWWIGLAASRQCKDGATLYAYFDYVRVRKFTDPEPTYSIGPDEGEAPVAALSASPTTVNIGEEVTFDASTSYDPDGTVEYYWFDYGDGSDSGWISSPTSIHGYTESGAYYAKAKVKDDDGMESEWSEPTEITADYIELAELYFPYLIFNEDEEYFPTDFYYDDENIDNNPSSYEETWPETAYIHTVYDYEEEWLTIEYWFYYVRDAKAWDIELPPPFPECWLAHDHDWESIYVFLAKQGTDYIPSRVTYFKHSYLKGINIEDFYSTASWDSWWVEKEDDTHPVVHVASGSHASYQRAVPIVEIGLPIYYLPEGDQGIPIPELVDGGLTLDHSHFEVKYVPTPDQTWPEEKFGDCIDAPWNRDRWDDPWYTMGPPKPVMKNSLSIFAESPVNLLVVNPEGQKVGWDPETETVVNEIIGAVYSGPGSEPQAIFIPENCSSLSGLDGNYAVLLAGISEGPYRLTIELATSEGVISQTHTEEVVEGAVYVYTVSITDEVVTASPDPIAELEHLKKFFDGLSNDSFDKPKLVSQRKNALFNKIDEVILKVEAGNYTDAIGKLFHDIRAKVDGDSTAQDWIVDPEAQTSLCVIIDHIISSIEALQQE